VSALQNEVKHNKGGNRCEIQIVVSALQNEVKHNPIP